MNKYLKYILFAVVLSASMSSCHDDDDTYGILDGINMTFRFASISEGATIRTNEVNQITLSYNNLVQINAQSATLNGQPVEAIADGMNVVFNLTLTPWVDYTLSIPEGMIARSDDASVSAKALEIKFNTNYGVNTEKLSTSLVNAKATPQAKKVYDYLLSIYGKQQLSGSMGDVGWGTQYSDMLAGEIGKYPAIVGFDYIHLPSSPSNWIDYSDISTVKRVWENGGIPQIQWHWNVPSSQGEGGTTTTLWEGETFMPADWSGNLQLTDASSLAIWATAKVGDIVEVTTKNVNTGANAQGSFKNSNWSEIGAGTEWFNITGDFSLTIDAGILESLQSGGLIVSGHDYTITKVQLISGGKADGSYSFRVSEFNPANVLIDGTWEHQVASADIEKLAGYISLLQDAGIPVLWRPFHEAAGDYTWGAWFWWGSQGVEVTKKLYRYLYDQLTNVYGLNNLIWVWTVQTSDAGTMADIELMRSAYPGDDVVDIVGTDLYPSSVLTDQTEQFFAVNDVVDSHKMVALTECGNLISPESSFNNSALWLYFMQWYDNTDGKFGHDYYPLDQWYSVIESPYVLFRGQLPNLN